MFTKEALRFAQSFCNGSTYKLRRIAAALRAGILLAALPAQMLAQHGGGGGGGGGRGIGGGSGISVGRPDGVSEKDDLKDFHRALALQASPEQIAAFRKVAQYTQNASDDLQSFRDTLKKSTLSSPWAESTNALHQAIASARAGNQNFLTSFTPAQKSGLQDLTKKLAKSDAAVDKQLKMLDDIVQAPKPAAEQVADSATALEKELAGFQNEQLALGREMGILLSDEGLTFNFPSVTNSINVNGQPITIPISGVASRASAQNGQNIFHLQLTADLSDLQQAVAAILRSQLARSPRCGERVQLEAATLTPIVPSSLVVANLHYERWACPIGSADSTPTEVDEEEATIQVKLAPSVQSTGLTLTSEITRVDAPGPLRNSLRSGELGAELRDQIAASLLSVLQKTSDLKQALPDAVQQSVTIEKIQFQDAGADQLGLSMEGQLQLSDDQARQLASQLKQNVTARAPAPQ